MIVKRAKLSNPSKAKAPAKKSTAPKRLPAITKRTTTTASKVSKTAVANKATKGEKPVSGTSQTSSCAGGGKQKRAAWDLKGRLQVCVCVFCHFFSPPVDPIITPTHPVSRDLVLLIVLSVCRQKPVCYNYTAVG